MNKAAALKSKTPAQRRTSSLRGRMPKRRALFSTRIYNGALNEAGRQGEDLRRFCNDYGLTQASLARITGCSPRALANWMAGTVPGKTSGTRLVELKRLFSALAEQVKPGAIVGWLERSNPAFDGSTPAQVIERGETDRIWRMIWELESGNTG